MKNLRHLITNILLLILLGNVYGIELNTSGHPAEGNCTFPDTAGAIKGKDNVCYGAVETYSVPAIPFATGYIWTLPSGVGLLSGANTNSIKVVFKASGGNITVEGTNTCGNGVASSLFVTVNALPTITLISPQKFCCDYGNVSLASSTFASPTGGTWTCRQNPSFINGNNFLTSNACNPTKSGIFSLTYEYQHPTTGCINKDSTKFSINPLPALKFDGGTICQNVEKVRLQSYVKVPINLNSMNDVQFKLIRTLPKVGGGFCSKNDLIKDEDASLNYDWWLTVSKSIIDLGTLTKDSLIIEITIQDGSGCFNRDTASFFIVKVPEITFNGFPELCIDAGIVNLTKTSNASPVGGCWSVIDKTGYKSKNFLTPGLNACDSLNTFKLSLQNGPGLYRMHYLYSANGCSAQRDTDLRIHPLPNVIISISPKGDKGKFCEVDQDVTLNAFPTGGAWSSSIQGVIGGGKFKPGSVPPAERDKWITLTYTYIHPTTKCDTAKSLLVFVQSKPLVDIVTPDYDTCRTKIMNFVLKADYKFTSKITWYQSADIARANFESNKQTSNQNPATFTIRPVSDSATNILITCQTEAEGVCPFSMDTMKIRIDTTSCNDSLLSFYTYGNKKILDISIYPNPSYGKFNIKINKPVIYSLRMYTIEGKLVLEKSLPGQETEIINQRFSKGNYTLVIEDIDGNTLKQRMIIE